MSSERQLYQFARILAHFQFSMTKMLSLKLHGNQ